VLDVQFIREGERDYPGIIRKVQERFLVEAGVMVQGAAVSLAPIDSGNLKGSITWRTEKQQGAFNVEGNNKTGTMISGPSGGQMQMVKASGGDEVHVGTNVEYAEYVEYGAGGRAAQPYMRPAIDENRRNLVRRLAELVKAEIEFGRN
jgi:HK97 gp10 family phage protein